MTVQSLWSLVRDGASRAHSSKPAVFNEDGACTYEELLSRSLGIAATLHEYGIGRDHRVGIWMDKSPDCVQAIMGVLAAGAAYVPLDPRAPWRRCRRIAQDCGFSGIIVDQGHLPSLTPFLEEQPPVPLIIHAPSDEITAADLPKTFPRQTFADAVLRPEVQVAEPMPSDLAYILYTSGSTGSPKGVMHTHASGLAFVQWIRQRFGIVPEDIFSSHAPFHFDLSISDLYASLGSGASVRVISSLEAMLAAHLVKLITQCGITVWYSVPSILLSMLDVGELERYGLPTLRKLFFAGEVFPTPQLRRLRHALPGVGLYNLFGPTETNVCTYYEVPGDIPEERNAPIPIGRACEHMETFVLDDTGKEAVEGVLWAKGGNLMAGYWNNAGRKAASVVNDPRKQHPEAGDLAYCTGDYVKLLPDGNYEFLGRRDHMIKTRGFRVELGEIESILSAHPGVLEAVAVPLPDAAIGNRIVASVVPRSGEELEANQLRAHCSRFMSTYMVPEQIEIRSAMSRTSTGKTDRQALLQEWMVRQSGGEKV